MAGYEIITVPTAPYGDMDLDAFKAAMNDEVAAVMMTCPNTLGLFNPHIKEICDIAHEHGRPRLLRRRQPERHPRQGPAGRRRFRRHPRQPAQDLRHAPRRRRAGERAGRGEEGADPVPADAAGRAADGRQLSLSNDKPRKHRPDGQLLRQLRRDGQGLRLHHHARPRGADRGQRAGGAECQLRHEPAEGPLRPPLSTRPACTNASFRPAGS